MNADGKRKMAEKRMTAAQRLIIRARLLELSATMDEILAQVGERFANRVGRSEIRRAS